MIHSTHARLHSACAALLFALLAPLVAAGATEAQTVPAVTQANPHPSASQVVSRTAGTQYDSGDPTADEQLVLEYINRARANPTAEGTRLAATNPGFVITEGLTTQQVAEVQARPPLAMNPKLLSIARSHNQDMYANNYFDHVDSKGLDPFQRMTNAGYSFTFAGENIAAASNFSAAQLEDLLMVDSGEPGRGHRLNLLSIYDSTTPVFQEVGIGMFAASTADQQGFATFQTQDFGTTGTGPLLLGVVYNDANGNNFYDIGEGIAGITLTPDSGSFFAVSSTSGGYGFPIGSSGTLNVTASGGPLTTPVTKTVTLNGQNIKLDFILSGVAGTGTGSATGTGTGTGTNAGTGTLTGTGTGTGTGGGNGATLTPTITSFSIRENLVHSTTAISFGGTLPIDNTLQLAGPVNITVGGVQATFQVSGKGLGGLGSNSFKVRVKTKKGVITPSTQSAPFTVKLAGNFVSQLASSGLNGPANTASGLTPEVQVNVILPLNLAYSGKTYATTVSVTFTSNGKTAKTTGH